VDDGAFPRLRNALRRIRTLIKRERANEAKDPLDGLPPILFNRSYRPSDDAIFYHYCNAETLRSIVMTKTLRFGDVNMMNDYGETAWGYRIFEEAASRLLELADKGPDFKDVNKEFLDQVDRIIGSSQMFVHPFGTSLSKDPDVLSQWRAYADNGRGFAIGFSGKLLKALPVTILEVEYGREKQIEEATNALGVIYMQYLDAGRTFDQDCKLSSRLMAANLFAFKNPRFAEEKEIRCIHLADVEVASDYMRLVDAGGTADGEPFPGVEVQFRVRDGGIVPFLDLPFPARLVPSAIPEIYLGPSNDNGSGNVLYLMGAMGSETSN
jgi:hypothetical protein